MKVSNKQKKSFKQSVIAATCGLATAATMAIAVPNANSVEIAPPSNACAGASASVTSVKPSWDKDALPTDTSSRKAPKAGDTITYELELKNDSWTSSDKKSTEMFVSGVLDTYINGEAKPIGQINFKWPRPGTYTDYIINKSETGFASYTYTVTASNVESRSISQEFVFPVGEDPTTTPSCSLKTEHTYTWSPEKGSSNSKAGWIGGAIAAILAFFGGVALFLKNLLHL
ncbi:hypothetical protein [Corynebacterium caspium]|uniref:hypothetical protein n=1 Tax=Corynebacterium caspium TaxID=234828 RepID=UPI0014616D82|nr:hypothetical protein [Corynebacterium caspium]